MFSTLIKTLPAILFLLRPASALAVQAHGGAEGLVSHQLGHLLYMSGMAFLLFHFIQKKWQGPGWSQFKGFTILIICWNAVTFVNHWLNEITPKTRFISIDGLIQSYRIETVSDALFYICSLDHLILVPAILMLYAALLQWKRTA
jgi:hypothetical protein